MEVLHLSARFIDELDKRQNSLISKAFKLSHNSHVKASQLSASTLFTLYLELTKFSFSGRSTPSMSTEEQLSVTSKWLSNWHLPLSSVHLRADELFQIINVYKTQLFYFG